MKRTAAISTTGSAASTITTIRNGRSFSIGRQPQSCWSGGSTTVSLSPIAAEGNAAMIQAYIASGTRRIPKQATAKIK